MPGKKPLFLLFILIVVLSGCGTSQYNGCKPVLMPYVEYDYKAVHQQIFGEYVRKNKEVIDFQGLKLAVPQGWKHEMVLAGKAIKISNEKNHFFILSFKKNIDIWCHIEDFYMVGCKNFVLKDQEKIKTKKEFYTDLYLLTDDKLDNDPTFWQYYILWCKTKFLRETDELIHYTGENLEAFQRNSKLGAACTKGGVVMHSEIFPKKIAPNYLSIASGFKDDAFFVEFLKMLNAMNPL